MDKEKSYFDVLYPINVNEKIEDKTVKGKPLKYLSWTWAIAEITKYDPNFTYEIEFFDGKPYLFDPKTGYMVFTNMTVKGVKKRMWLPVMDGSNEAMTDHPYKVETKYNGPKTVQAATMFDINKTIMRCLTKNISLFGLGLYIYAGEDLPEGDDVVQSQPTQQPIQQPIVQQQPKPQKKAVVLPTEFTRSFEDAILELVDMGSTLEKVATWFKFIDPETKQADITKVTQGHVEYLINARKENDKKLGAK